MSRDQGEVASPFIRPFRSAIPEADIDDLRGRLSRTRWPERETVDDWSQGAPLEYVREVCRYWATDYDWRRVESQLNSYQQGVTTIDGLDIHFLHAPSPTPGAQPLMIVHGWPGSVFEHLDIIEPLRNPEVYGGQSEDAYHVVVPSLPGFGFSQKPSQRGWTVERTGAALAELMQRLGYPRFFVQGGDWGSIVAASMGTRQLDSVRGIHFKPGHLRSGRAAQARRSDAGGKSPARQAAVLQRLGRGLLAATEHPTADDRLRASRLTGRAVRMDIGEVRGMDRLRRSSRECLDARQDARRDLPLLVHCDSSVFGPSVLGKLQTSSEQIRTRAGTGRL